LNKVYNKRLAFFDRRQYEVLLFTGLFYATGE